MALENGTQLGPFTVLERLGAGGMGEVYKAHDPRLGRVVAVKVLAADRSREKAALARFEREARMASALNHPIIVNIYEIGEAQTPAGPTSYIAMEYVDGQTLRERLRGGLSWKGLVEPLAQVADALAKAHKAGIVHRDLKPENIMITPDGYPKLLDFGLAKLMEGDDGASVAGESDVTESFEERTRAGTILGTPGYMSPEQVQGKPLDHRSDIFSFGCMLYEAASGRRAFKGNSQVETLSAILRDEPPPLESLNGDAPPELRRIVRRCLAKDPEQRYQSIKDVANDLRELAKAALSPNAGQASTIVSAAVPASPRSPTRGRLVLAAGAALLVAALAVGLASLRNAAPSPARATAPLQVEKITNRGRANNPALSQDGRYLAYSALADDRSALFLRDLAEKTETRLAAAMAIEGVSALRFARDGRAIFCRLQEKGRATPALYKVPLIGGEPRLIHDGFVGAISADDRRLAFVDDRDGQHSLVVSDLDSGLEKPIAQLSGERFAWSPDGTRLLYQSKANGNDFLFVIDADGAHSRNVGVVRGSCRWWMPDGAGALCAVATDERRREVALFGVDLKTGVTRRIGDRSWQQINGLYWLPDGSAFVVNEIRGGGRNGLYRVSYPDGKVERIPSDDNSYWGLQMTSDGRKLVSVQDVERSDLLVATDPESGTFKKIAAGSGVSYRASWTADDKIVYSSNEAGSYDLYVVDADGANRKQLTADPASNETQPAASPDGRYIVFVSDRSGTKRLYRINRDGSRLKSLTPDPPPRYEDNDPRFTPDSQWVIYRYRDNGSTLWKVPIEGGTPLMIKGARPATGGVIEEAFGASASPDGRSLAFLYFVFDTKVDPTRVDIAVATLDGTIVKRFPSHDTYRGGIADDERVQWSRDGSALYYRLSKAGMRNIWKRPLAGGQPVQVTRFEEPVDYFDWSLDGKKLVVSRSSTLSDVVLITNFR